MTNSLGNRLEAALSLIELCGHQELIADIGSDHAFLAIEAKRRLLTDGAIASDINKLPLEKGKENAEKHNITIDFVLSDGFDRLEDKKLTAAAICGMGGELIGKMVLRSYIAHQIPLILQPMSAQEELRRILWENGFEIITERFVQEAGKVYVLLLAKHCGCAFNYSYTDLYLGKERPNTDDFAEYCKKVHSGALKRRIGLVARGENTSDIDELLEVCQTQTVSF